MSETQTSAGGVGVARLPVDRPRAAVDFLHARGGGVMDLIAHFWDRLPQTPPLSRGDLHLVIASKNLDMNTNTSIDSFKHPPAESLAGAMLYVPKAHRADVLATDAASAAAFAQYIGTVGANGEGKTAIDFLTGEADGIHAMVPYLLPLVHRRTPARALVNHVMELPPEATAKIDPQVRLAKDGDNTTLNKWRTMYKQERGILFDADIEAWVQSGKVFVYETDGKVVALAKFDLDLASLVEIGGVFTFPEFRRQGFGGRLVMDLAERIRQAGKTPLLQVDTENDPAYTLYQHLGWRSKGKLARVWLTGK